jgi:hypothetical protein
MRQVVIGHRREVKRGDRVIEAVDKVDMGIEERSVEIKDDKGRGQCWDASELSDEGRKSNALARFSRLLAYASDFQSMTLFWLSFDWRAV